MPPEYVLELLPVEVLGAVAVVAASIWIGGRVRKGIAVLRPWLVWVRQFREDWSGVAARPGHERVPGIPERMSSLEDAVPGMTVGLREVKEVQAEHTDQLAAAHEAVAANVRAVAESKVAVAEVAEALAEVRYNVKPNSGSSAHDQLRELLVEALAELAALRNEFNDALHHNHPDYRPQPRPTYHPDANTD